MKTLTILLLLSLASCAGGGATEPMEKSTLFLYGIYNSTINLTITGAPQQTGAGGAGGTASPSTSVAIPVQVGPGGLPALP